MEGEILYLYLGPDAFAGFLLDGSEKVAVKTDAMQHCCNNNECQQYESGETHEDPYSGLPQPRVRAGKLVLRRHITTLANALMTAPSLLVKMPGQCLQNTGLI